MLCSNYFHNIFTTNFNDKLLLILIWIHYNFISNFTIFFFTITYFLNIYTFFNFFSSLTFSSPHYPLSSTLYFNIAIHLSLHLPLFVSSYPFLLTINLSLFSILCIVFSHKKALSLSLNVLVDFYFLLHLRFRLINFCAFKNSNLGWYDLVLCFELLLFLFCSLIVKFYPITL